MKGLQKTAGLACTASLLMGASALSLVMTTTTACGGTRDHIIDPGHRVTTKRPTGRRSDGIRYRRA